MSILDHDDIRAAVEAARNIGEFDTALDIIDQYRLRELADVWARIQHGTPLDDLSPEKSSEAITRVDSLVHADLVVRATMALMESKRAIEQLHPGPPVLPPEPIWAQLVVHQQRGTNNLRFEHYYDSIDNPLAFNRMFGNANVGDTGRTNLQMGSMLVPGDGAFATTAWWVDTLPRVRELSGTVAFNMDDRREQTANLHTLMRQKQPLYVFMGPRQYMQMGLDFYNNDHEVINDAHARLFIHVEGWSSRSVI